MTAESILAELASHTYDVVLANTDQCAALAYDLAALRRVNVSCPTTPKILLLDACDREVVVKAFRSGIRGLFSAGHSDFRALCKCIHRVRDGQVWASAEQLGYLLDAVSRVPSLRVVNGNGNQLLTAREEQVVALVADGLTNREIAGELGLREDTIKTYLFRIFDKLGMSSRVELALYVVHHGEHHPAEWLAASAYPS
jgi:DNA-binding NarL/FixJ family response regulator